MRLTVTSNPNTEGAFEALLRRAKSGEDDAKNELFESFYPRVQRKVHHSLDQDLRRSRPWLKARFSTGDVVQEVFRSVISDLDTFGGTTERAFAGYLSMVVRNRIIDVIRFHEAEQRDGRRKGNPLVEEQHESDEIDPAQRAVTTDEIDRLLEAMSTFPERDQLLLRARLEDMASFPELAEQLGFGSVSAVRRAFFSAQAKLALRLDAGLEGEDAP